MNKLNLAKKRIRNKKSFLGQKKGLIYELELKCENFELPVSDIYFTLATLIPFLYGPYVHNEENQTVKNLKGVSLKSGKEESFLYFAGTINTSELTPVEEEETEEQEEVEEDFYYNLKTTFKEYTTKGEILHDFYVNTSHSEVLNLVKTPIELCHFLPLKISEISFSMEGYSKEFFGALFGVVLKNDSKLILNLNKSGISISGLASTSPKSPLSIQTTEDLLKTLEESLAKCGIPTESLLLTDANRI